MKKIKRILAVILLVALILVVGYLNFSGSRLFSKCDIENYKDAAFYATNSNTYLLIDNEMKIVYGVNDEEKELDYLRMKDGVLMFSDGNNSYNFIATSEGSLYDTQMQIILYRST